jgi:hypothetical protein
MPMLKQLLWRRFILPAAAVCALSVPVTAAQAALVNYSFTGNIDGIAPVLAPVSGSFRFDSDPTKSGGVYNGVVTGFTLKVGGGFSYQSTFAPGANAVTISQNTPMAGGSGDRWALVSAATGPTLTGTDYSPFSFDLRLDRVGGGLFGNTNLQNPPSFADFATSNLTAARWRLFFEDVNGNPAVVLGSISSLTAVPLPAGVVLFGIGLISLVGLGAGGLRNLRGSQA